MSTDSGDIFYLGFTAHQDYFTHFEPSQSKKLDSGQVVLLMDLRFSHHLAAQTERNNLDWP